MALCIPALRNPLTAISGRSLRLCQDEMIQFALFDLMTVAVTSTRTSSSETPSLSCCWTCSAYHAWNHFFISSFIGLFMDTSRGCNLSAVGGYRDDQDIVLLEHGQNIWPRKQSKIAKAGWVAASFNSLRFREMKGTMVFSM